MCECGTSKTGNYFAKVGGQFGDRLQSFGEGIVTRAQKRFKDWTGLGDYRIVYNSLINNDGPEPDTFRTNNRGLIIKHKEYLGDVVTASTTPGAFGVTRFQINPGNVITFPWLNPIALQYDQYRPRGIIFEFVSTASDTSTGVTLGSVVMSTNYDVTDPDPLSKSDMLNRAYSSEAKMSDNMSHGLECDPTELPKSLFYIRPTASVVQDVRDYDMANFYVATQGGNLAVNTIVGSLYVHYEFEFFKQVPIGGLLNKSMLYSAWQESYTDVSGLPLHFNQHPSWALVAGRDLGIVLSGLTMTFPRRYAGATFKFEALCQNIVTSQNSASPAAFTPFNCTTSTLLGPAGYYFSSPRFVNLTTQFSFVMIIRINDNISSDATITFTTRLGPFPATSVSPGTTTCRYTLEVIPSNYLALQ